MPLFWPKTRNFYLIRMPCSVPVLLLAFNRPGKTAKVLEQIRHASPVRVYAHCDGPRRHVRDDLDRTEQVKRLIEEQLGSFEVKTLFRTTNAGLRRGVYEALNWFFEQEEFGIILEDDCVPDPSLFPFCEELLLRYRDDQQIMHIGCSNLAGEYAGYPDGGYVFSRFSFVWGWASWRRAWQAMSIDLEGLELFERSGGLKRFLPDPMAQAYMYTKFQATKSGKNNSWAYAWFYSVLKNNGLCIVPKTNLVQNVGVGESDATNTTTLIKNSLKKAQPMHFPIVHPNNKSVDPKLEQLFFYTSQKSRFRLYLWYFLHVIGLR